jgi:hypothetical protein
MTYQFRVVLSGPCAYVPNTVVGSGTPATSWSAVMPQLNIGRTIEESSGQVFTIPRHFTVLQYPTALFDTDFPPDLVLQRKDEPAFGIVLLSRARIRILTAESPAYIPNDCGLSDAELAQGGVDANSSCIDWIPRIERLFAGAGTFGRNDMDLFDAESGFPGAAVAAHTLLDHGRLVADSLVPKDFSPPGTKPPLWGFRVNPDLPNKATQSVAYTVALELNRLSAPVQIAIESAMPTRNLKLRFGTTANPVEIEVKNREFDEIVKVATGTIQTNEVDRDFKILYFLSQQEANPTPLPFLLREGGAGTLRATCGGGQFEGFDSSLAAAMAKW